MCSSTEAKPVLKIPSVLWFLWGHTFDPKHSNTASNKIESTATTPQENILLRLDEAMIFVVNGLLVYDSFWCAAASRWKVQQTESLNGNQMPDASSRPTHSSRLTLREAEKWYRKRYRAIINAFLSKQHSSERAYLSLWLTGLLLSEVTSAASQWHLPKSFPAVRHPGSACIPVSEITSQSSIRNFFRLWRRSPSAQVASMLLLQRKGKNLCCNWGM